MLICILTKNVITSCSVTMMLFLHLEVKPLMTLTTVLYLSCALISGHLAMMLMELTSIEALKPAIEACGISTLSQSPMLGFHKQMDNRIKLLEEILSFRMQGVEFDNGDMYVDGHKAASDVRDEFVSVTEKLMDELAQCYNVLPQLDINNTIDHRPEGDEKWFLENEKTVTQFCRKLAAERPLKDIRDEYNYPKKKGIKDEC